MRLSKYKRKPVTKTYKKTTSGRMKCCSVKSTVKKPRIMKRMPWKPKPLKKKDEHPGLPVL